jgi:hypothetical protein
LKCDESETLNEELRRAYEAIHISENNAQIVIRSKDDEVLDLTNKLNELEIVISKYGQNLTNIKHVFDKTVEKHQIDLQSKNNDMKLMREKYERKIRDLQNKIEEILLKENIFIQSLNSNNLNNNNNNSSYSSNNRVTTGGSDPYVYIPKEIPDDEEVRRNINEQINYVIFSIYLILDKK